MPIPFELKYNMHIALILICGLAIWHAESANVAIPKSQTSCTAEVKFPVKVSLISSYQGIITKEYQKRSKHSVSA